MMNFTFLCMNWTDWLFLQFGSIVMREFGLKNKIEKFKIVVGSGLMTKTYVTIICIAINTLYGLYICTRNYCQLRRRKKVVWHGRDELLSFLPTDGSCFFSFSIPTRQLGKSLVRKSLSTHRTIFVWRLGAPDMDEYLHRAELLSDRLARCTLDKFLPSRLFCSVNTVFTKLRIFFFQGSKFSNGWKIKMSSS